MISIGPRAGNSPEAACGAVVGAIGEGLAGDFGGAAAQAIRLHATNTRICPTVNRYAACA
jgi:hypothetical protein